MVGVCAAYFLARAGYGVRVLDAGDVGGGATSASGSAVLTQTKASSFLLDLTRRSMELYDSLASDAILPYQRNGSYVLFKGPDQAEFVSTRASWLRKNGIDVEILGRKDLERVLPDIAPDVGGASYNPTDAQIAPREACTALAHAASRLGVLIETGCRVMEFDIQGGRVRALMTSKGRYESEYVILAAGPWTADLASKLGLRLPLTPQKGEQLHSSPVAHRLPGMVIGASYLMSKFGADAPATEFSAGLSLSQGQDGRLKIGSTREWAGFDLQPTARGKTALLEKLGEYFPAYTHLTIEAHTAGLRPYSSLNHPIVASTVSPTGVVLACGHGGDGIALAPVTGWLITQMIRGIPTGLESSLALGEPSSRP